MKNAIAMASLGLASCKVGELSLANSLYEKNKAEALRNERIIAAQQLTEDDDAADEGGEDGDETKREGEVQKYKCVRMKDDYHLWDLKLLENGVDSDPLKIGADISGKRDDADANFTTGAEAFEGRFMYKICQSQWRYPHDEFDAPKSEDMETFSRDY